MVKKRTSSASAAEAITAKRAARLYRLLKILGDRPQTRDVLTRRLRLNVRGFYRDLELLRSSGITLVLQDRRYALKEDLDDAVARLPLPDPHLSLGEAMQLAKGRSSAHKKLQEQITAIIS
jgi:hypothetical protein